MKRPINRGRSVKFRCETDYYQRGLTDETFRRTADRDLRAILETLDPKARDDLRRALIHDQADRDAIASHLLRCRDRAGNDWADIIDMLTMHPEERRRVVRLLGEIDASD